MNEWFYLYIFTQLFIIEFLSLFLFVLSVHIWINDLILSLFKKHSPLYSFLFITILLFINSEALLFLSYLLTAPSAVIRACSIKTCKFSFSKAILFLLSSLEIEIKFIYIFIQV